MRRWSQRFGRFISKGSILAITFGLALPIAATVDNSLAQAKRQREGSGRMLMRGPEFGEGGHLMRIALSLDLTETQKQQMQLIADQFRAETDALNREIRTVRREVHQSLFDGTFDEAEASERLAEVGRLEAQLMGYRHQMMQEMKLILTPEQLDKLEQARDRMGDRRYFRRIRGSQ